MKKTFLFLLLFLSLSAEAQIKKFEERYPDGKICATGFKDKKTGKFEGHWKVYSKQGDLIEECDYKDGLEDGKLIRYNFYNIVSSITEYRNGKKEGKYVKYYEPEDSHDKPPVYIIATYQNDEFHGMHYTFERDGKISKRTRYEEGWVVADTTITDDGIYYERIVTDPKYPQYSRMEKTFVPFNKAKAENSEETPKTQSRPQASHVVRRSASASARRKASKSQKPQKQHPVVQKSKPRLQTTENGVIVVK